MYDTDVFVDNVLCYKFTVVTILPPAMTHITCKTPLVGHLVRLSKSSYLQSKQTQYHMLSFCEVQVWGKHYCYCNCKYTPSGFINTSNQIKRIIWICCQSVITFVFLGLRVVVFLSTVETNRVIKSLYSLEFYLFLVFYIDEELYYFYLNSVQIILSVQILNINNNAYSLLKYWICRAFQFATQACMASPVIRGAPLAALTVTTITECVVGEHSSMKVFLFSFPSVSVLSSIIKQ